MYICSVACNGQMFPARFQKEQSWKIKINKYYKFVVEGLVKIHAFIPTKYYHIRLGKEARA